MRMAKMSGYEPLFGKREKVMNLPSGENEGLSTAFLGP